jgi:beta-lactamase superfamily II metal-dependent hydrolase
MLKFHFINVEDGDAALAELSSTPFERREGRPWRMLVDVGREVVPKKPGLGRVTCLEYLEQNGVRTIDLLVITHLHFDHFEGLKQIIGRVRIHWVVSSFFSEEAAYAEPRPDSEKTVRDLILALNEWSVLCDSLRKEGAVFQRIDRSVTLPVPDASALLRVSVTHEDRLAEECESMCRVLSGVDVPDAELYRASKLRNPESLRLQLVYAGRTALLCADCFGEGWETSAKPCDLLKVPHHGDCKAVTERLITNLRPKVSVISCGSEYIERKDRPSEKIIGLLEAYGSSVYFTDAYPAGTLPGSVHRAVVVTLVEDGTMAVSESGMDSRRFE